MWEKLKSLFVHPDGILGLADDFVVNLGSEFVGIILTAALTAIAVQGFTNYVHNRKWRQARAAFARRFIVPHLSLIEAFEHFVRAGAALPDKDADFFQEVLEEQRISLSRSIERHSYLINPDISHVIETYRSRFSALVEEAPLILQNRPAVIHLRDDPGAKGKIFVALHEALLDLLKVLERNKATAFHRRLGRLAARAQKLDQALHKLLSYQVVDALYLESDERRVLPELVRPREA